jgi:hemerythrin-like domain-containing protein
VCEHCGCKGVPPVRELMDEHVALVEQADRVRSALATGDRLGALTDLRVLVERLHRHVHREEAGIFTALREQGEFADEVTALEGEHEDLDAAIAGLDPDAPGFTQRVARLFDELSAHIEREDLGVFPVSVVTLGATGWDVVERAHEESPSFLLDAAAPSRL